MSWSKRYVFFSVSDPPIAGIDRQNSRSYDVTDQCKSPYALKLGKIRVFMSSSKNSL